MSRMAASMRLPPKHLTTKQKSQHNVVLAWARVHRKTTEYAINHFSKKKISAIAITRLRATSARQSIHQAMCAANTWAVALCRRRSFPLSKTG